MRTLSEVLGDVFPSQLTEKGHYFESGAAGYRIPRGLPPKLQEEWKREFFLCNCGTCYDQSCGFRNKLSRFPEDAGGLNQCLRLMKEKTPFAYRNSLGFTEIIPEEIIEEIIAAIREGCER